MLNLCHQAVNQLTLDVKKYADTLRLVPSSCCAAEVSQAHFSPLPLEVSNPNLNDFTLCQFVIQTLLSNMSTVCDQCSLQRNIVFENRLNQISLSMSHGVCNIRCKYCIDHCLDNINIFKDYDLVYRIIKSLFYTGILENHCILKYSSGEFTINTYQQELYYKLKSFLPDAKFLYSTNATIYHEIIAHELSRGGWVHVNIPSVDNDLYHEMTLSSVHINQVLQNLSTYLNCLRTNGHPAKHMTLRLFIHELIDKNGLELFVEKIHEFGLQDVDIRTIRMLGKYEISSNEYTKLKDYLKILHPPTDGPII